MVGQLKSSTGMIINGKEVWGPAQQGLLRENQRKCHIWRHAACNLVGWRAEPSMAIPAVHIAPPGTNAVDARGMARWLSGGGLMVVCPRLDACTWNPMLVEHETMAVQ